MHCLTFCTLVILIFMVFHTLSAPSTKCSTSDPRSCLEKSPDVRRRRSDESTWDAPDDNNDDEMSDDESQEERCEHAIDIVRRHRHFPKLDSAMFLTYCPHYNDRLTFTNNHTLYDSRQRREAVKKRDWSSSDSDEDDKRRALRRRELRKRFALRFLHKRMS